MKLLSSLQEKVLTRQWQFRYERNFTPETAFQIINHL